MADDFNSLPIETRKICGVVIAEMRISQLKMEKERLKKRYRQSVREVNDHIRNLKNFLSTERPGDA